MSRRLPRQTDGAGMEAGLGIAAGAGYLGDPEVVESVVRDFAARVLDAQTDDEAKKACDDAAFVFTGIADGFTPMAAWNTRAGLGMSLCANLDIDPAQDYESILRTAFAQYAVQLLSVRAAAADHDEEWIEWNVAVVIEHATSAMLGTLAQTHQGSMQ